MKVPDPHIASGLTVSPIWFRGLMQCVVQAPSLCVMAGRHIENLLDDGSQSYHPISLLRKAYGI